VLCTSSLPNTVFLCELTSVGHAESLSTLLSLHTTQHLPCTLCDLLKHIHPILRRHPPSISRQRQFPLSRWQCLHPPSTNEKRAVMAKRCKTQLRLVIHTCASENLISEKHNGQAGPERPFSPPSSKGAMARSEQEVDELAFRFGRSKTRCGMLDGRGIRESRRGYVGYATWTSGDVAS